MKLGLNLSFAVKRWLDPEELAGVLADEIGITDVQFSWDMIDPWWPDEQRNALASAFGEAFAKSNIRMGSTFGGTASYHFARLLAPTEEQRAIAEGFLKRAVDLTVELGAAVVGTPLGGMTHRDAYYTPRRDFIYGRTLEAVTRITEYAKRRGLKRFVIEPVPVETEFPYDPDGSRQLVEDLSATCALPVGLLLDWGHALFEPLLKEQANMDVWLERCGDYVDSFHLQQTDGSLDGHWSFSRDGHLSPERIDAILARHDLSQKVQYLELIYPFEYTDAFVLEDVKRTVRFLKG